MKFWWFCSVKLCSFMDTENNSIISMKLHTDICIQTAFLHESELCSEWQVHNYPWRLLWSPFAAREPQAGSMKKDMASSPLGTPDVPWKHNRTSSFIIIVTSALLEGHWPCNHNVPQHTPHPEASVNIARGCQGLIQPQEWNAIPHLSVRAPPCQIWVKLSINLVEVHCYGKSIYGWAILERTRSSKTGWR